MPGFTPGGVQRELTRVFPDSLSFRPFSVRNDWEYRGAFGGIGVRFDPSASTRLSAAATFAEIYAPSRVRRCSRKRSTRCRCASRLGASQVVASRLLATVSAQYTGWSRSQNYRCAGNTTECAHHGAPNMGCRGRPRIRRAAHGHTRLPAACGRPLLATALPSRDNQWPRTRSDNELVGALGLGLRLAADDFGPLAVADLSVERGRRTGWGLTSSTSDSRLTENFWRISASVSLFGR